MASISWKSPMPTRACPVRHNGARAIEAPNSVSRLRKSPKTGIFTRAENLFDDGAFLKLRRRKS
jgi:hypothetical protein